MFLVAWRRRDELPGEPLPWLYGVARKVLANHRRGGARREALAERAAAHAPGRVPDLAEAVGVCAPTSPARSPRSASATASSSCSSPGRA